MGKPDLAWFSLALTIFIAACAILLGVHLWRDRGRRDGALSEVDRRHFLRQDIRRAGGIVLMALLAAGIFVGSRLPTRVIASAGEAHPNRRFLAVWLSVFASIMVLLGLAIIDWISTRRYARRHREAMNRERIEILRETVRRHDSARNGSADTPDPGPF